MEKCRMNYQGVRPYSPPNREMPARNNCGRRTPCGCNCDMVDNTSIYEHADKLRLPWHMCQCRNLKPPLNCVKHCRWEPSSLNCANHSVEREVAVDERMQTQQSAVNAADQ